MIIAAAKNVHAATEEAALHSSPAGASAGTPALYAVSAADPTPDKAEPVRSRADSAT